MELKKWKIKKNQETDVYGRHKRPKTEKLKRKEQEIWANAHETRHSISIISYAGCFVDLQQFQRKFTRAVYAVA